MFDEKKFHKLIEKQDNDRKEKSWEKLKDKLPECDDGADIIQSNGKTVAVKTDLKKIILPVAAVLLVLISVLVLILLLKPDKSVQDPFRFCNQEDYKIESVEQTLKDYSQQNNNNILYFDWYDETESCEDVIVVFKENDEIICFQESLIDMNAGYKVTLYVTDTFTELDFLQKFNTCSNNYAIGDIKIKWDSGTFAGYAQFEKNGFNYFLEIDDPEAPETILEYVTILLG